MVKMVQMPVRQVERAFTEGIWFDGSAIEGFARVAESDMYLQPDPTTFAIIPWATRPIGRLICDVYTPTGEPFPGDPRAVLRRALDAAKQLGYRYIVAPELEFFLFRRPLEISALLTDDKASYFDMSENDTREVCLSIADALASM